MNIDFYSRNETRIATKADRWVRIIAQPKVFPVVASFLSSSIIWTWAGEQRVNFHFLTRMKTLLLMCPRLLCWSFDGTTCLFCNHNKPLLNQSIETITSSKTCTQVACNSDRITKEGKQENKGRSRRVRVGFLHQRKLKGLPRVTKKRDERENNASIHGLSLSMLPRIPLVLILTGISMHHHWQVVYSRFFILPEWRALLDGLFDLSEKGLSNKGGKWSICFGFPAKPFPNQRLAHTNPIEERATLRPTASITLYLICWTEGA